MDLEKARFNMIEQQVRPWSVLDQTVLQTMGNIPRDAFVPEPLASLAYADMEVPLAHGEAMMFPRVEGRMLQELELDIDDECLEIGTGSGYVTACMAMMAKQVHSIDIYDDFLESAASKLAQQNIANVELEHKNALKDYIEGSAPERRYDAIAVTGSVPEYMPVFEQMLKPGGRLFIIVGETGGNNVMHAMKITRSNDNNAKNEFTRSSLFETTLKPLVGVKQKSGFSF
jgi:protein-L-isoaspartate(D-aspartate) O-methyltransferase